jgi:hypothetical protein
LHDRDIKPEDILAFDETLKELNIYIMSVALKPEYQNLYLDLKEFGFEKLYNSLIDKLSRYYDLYGCEVQRIASIGWTAKG